MMRLLCLWFLLIGFHGFIGVSGGSYEIDDRIFSVSYLPKVDDDLLLGEDPNVIKMVTKDKEAFTCILPKLDLEEKGGPALHSDHETPTSNETPHELIVSAFDKTCVYKVGVYWTYEYCHGSTISQFHASRVGENPGDKYFLGRSTKTDIKKQLDALESKKPAKLRLNNEDIPFLEIVMAEGTKCDLNNLPRQSRVRFVCSEAEYKFISVQETFTCEYEVIIGFSALCKHKHFKPKEEFFPIQCHLTGPPRDNPKPLSLINLEKGNINAKLDFFFGKQSGSVELLIKTGDSEFVPSQPLNTDTPRPDLWRPSRREPFRPLTDPHVAERFLLGDYCLYGGSGWWMYEFCYGKSVTQYHEEKGSPRVEIVLGQFKLEDHTNWIHEHPGKKPKKVGRKFVSHFYSRGDFCEESGAKRHVEVKLKCKKTNSASSVTIYLLEPATCEYVLGVESPLVCDILHLADEETGLMTFDKNDFLKKKEDEEEELADASEIITADSLRGTDIDHQDFENVLNNPPVGPDSGYDNILQNIQLEQASHDFIEKQKWLNEKESSRKAQGDHKQDPAMSKEDDVISREEQDAMDSVLINSAREARSSYESILNNIQDQLEQAGQNFMEKQKWLGEKDPLDHFEEDDEEEPENELHPRKTDEL